MDASDLGFEAVLYAIVGSVVGVLLAGFVVAVVAGALGGRRLSLLSVGMGLVVAIAAVVDAVVIWRTVGGEVTGWDLIWAAGLTTAGVFALRQLASSPHTASGAM